MQWCRKQPPPAFQDDGCDHLTNVPGLCEGKLQWAEGPPHVTGRFVHHMSRRASLRPCAPTKTNVANIDHCRSQKGVATATRGREDPAVGHPYGGRPESRWLDTQRIRSNSSPRAHTRLARSRALVAILSQAILVQAIRHVCGLWRGCAPRRRLPQGLAMLIFSIFVCLAMSAAANSCWEVRDFGSTRTTSTSTLTTLRQGRPLAFEILAPGVDVKKRQTPMPAVDLSTAELRPRAERCPHRRLGVDRVLHARHRHRGAVQYFLRHADVVPDHPLRHTPWPASNCSGQWSGALRTTPNCRSTPPSPCPLYFSPHRPFG